MVININNRKKQVDKIRGEYGSNPYFEATAQLYYKNILKRITSVTKLLKKIKYKKDGSVDKRTNRQINKIINTHLTVIQPPKKFLGKSEIKIDYDKIENKYDYITHKIEFQKVKKEFKKALYIQEIKYYNADGEELNKIITYTDDISGETFELDFTNKEFESEKPIKDKSFLESLNLKMSTSLDGFYIWYPMALISFINKDYYTIITTTAYEKQQIENIQVEQEFQDDDDGVCVYNNFVRYFFSKEKNKNAKAIYNKLKKSENIAKYRKSYKKDELKEICDFCDCSLYIRDLVNGKKKDIIITNEYARFKIEMVNTKYNHLDLLMSDGDINQVTEKEYNKIKKNSSFYVEKYGQLQNLEGVYKIKPTKFQELKNEWRNDYGIQEKYIYDDTFEYKLIDTYDYKLHSFFNPFEIDNDLYNEVDLSLAYYNYSNKLMNKNYIGMPTGNFINSKCSKDFDINNYEQLMNNDFVGFFQVKIKNIKSKKEHLNKLNFVEGGKYTLTSPLINLLKNHVEFKFYSCSYSTKCDIPFDTKLQCGFSFLDKDDGVKSYCKMFGLLLCDSTPVKIKVKPLKMDMEYYNIINDENYNVYDVNGILNITYENEKFKSYKHMAYFIHSYTRTLIIEQILKMDINSVFGVKLDSIVYKKDSKFEYDENIFKIKKGKIQSLFKGFMNTSSLDSGIDDDDNEDDITDSGYYTDYFSESEFINAPLPFLHNNNIYHMIYKRIIFLAGMGGSGKTYSLLFDGLNKSNTCYTSSSWNLIQGMKNRYNDIICYSIPNLTGMCNGKSVEKIYNPNIKYIIIDELTLINKNDINNIIQNYPNAIIFLVGDIDFDGFYYQCSMPKLPIFNPSNTTHDIQYIKYTQNYRHDDNLTSKMLSMRKFMKTLKDSPFKLLNLKKWVSKVFKSCFYDKKDIIYNNNDVGISATDDFKRGNNVTDYFINKGTKPKYFIKTTNRKTNQLRGQEIDTLPSHKNYEMKLFKTIHSFQGLDLDQDNNIIISIDKNFDYNLFYTALSRARREDQIKLIA